MCRRFARDIESKLRLMQELWPLQKLSTINKNKGSLRPTRALMRARSLYVRWDDELCVTQRLPAPDERWSREYDFNVRSRGRRLRSTKIYLHRSACANQKEKCGKPFFDLPQFCFEEEKQGATSLCCD